ncbi:alpha/beta hydrolase [Curtobacterium sp. UCD-KPL2560]|uniref:alpha/beta fold hydrolase n=1 Tax=Curtobacterium sp. UCD-KPL2560 TaxID=1885315 RepID=UPI000824C19B|nr:alpha/beta hydrolase [Curtobacterium sp. UCD-KPL2560]
MTPAAPTAPTTPTVVLVHGAFADSSSWNAVAAQLAAAAVDVVAFANPLRSVRADAGALVDLVRSLDRPVVLVGHSYGGMVATQAAADLDGVTALVFVGAFVPAPGESAGDLAGRFPGSTLGDTLVPTPLTDGGTEFRIDPARFHQQFAHDVEPAQAAAMAVAQRPVTEGALGEPLGAASAAWSTLPSWSVFGDDDRNIPVASHRWMAERAGFVGVTELAGASHAIAVSQPDAVAAAVLAAVRHGA